MYKERKRNQIPAGDPVLFLEVTVADPSEFASQLEVVGEGRHGYRIHDDGQLGGGQRDRGRASACA